MIPRTVVIDQGGTVTFQMGGRNHQVGIYDDGTTPEQVSAAQRPRRITAPVHPGTGDPNLSRFSAVDLRRWRRRCPTRSTPLAAPAIRLFIPHLDLGIRLVSAERSRP
jgi:hypothetical protein